MVLEVRIRPQVAHGDMGLEVILRRVAGGVRMEIRRQMNERDSDYCGVACQIELDPGDARALRQFLEGDR